MSDEPFWMSPKNVRLNDGTQVTLKPEVDEDLESTWGMFSTLLDESLEFLPIPFTRERVEAWFKNIDYESHLPILGHVAEDGKMRVIASATLGFQQMELYRHRAEFGITIHDDYQGRGLGKILTHYMIEIARDRGMKKIDLMVVAHNRRAISVYERFGFEVEGHFRMNHFNHVLNEYCDEYKMGLVLEE